MGLGMWECRVQERTSYSIRRGPRSQIPIGEGDYIGDICLQGACRFRPFIKMVFSS